MSWRPSEATGSTQLDCTGNEVEFSEFRFRNTIVGELQCITQQLRKIAAILDEGIESGIEDRDV